MPVLSKNEKKFEYYIVLPVELRKVVIEEMESNDRCRFRRCSKSSDEEVKTSKNVCYKLKFRAFDNANFYIEVAHKKQDIISYALNFVEEESNKYMRCLDVENKELWKVEFDNSTNLPLYAADYFKKLLEPYQNKIKELEICGLLFEEELKGYDFGINNLKNVEYLRINGNTKNLQYLSKLRCPLKEFFAIIVENELILTDCQEVYEVQNFLIMPYTKFTNEQFLQLSAENVTISIGDVTEMDIFHFIRLWQNGTRVRRFASYTWRMKKESNWDMTKLLTLLEVEFDFDEQRAFEIQIELFKQPNTRAMLIYVVGDEDFNNLEFNVKPA